MSDYLLDRLAEIVGSGHVLQGEPAAAYLTEWRGAFDPVALAVVRPADTQAVARIIQACADAGCAVVAQSGNTGLVGGSAASDARRHVIISLERMNRIRSVDTDNATMTVEAGCILADAQDAASRAGFYLPLTLASQNQCRIGGNLATNAGGLNVIRYGNTRELVLGLEVVLADGRVWNNLTGLRKDNSGLDLRDLFIGSEGALGVITAAVMRLHTPHRQRTTALCAVASPAHAVALQRRLVAASGENLVGCELMSGLAVELAVRHMADCDPPFERGYDWYLLVELASAADGEWLAPILKSVVSCGLQSGALSDARVAQNASDAASLWHLRESLPAAQVAEGASIKHDIAVPVSSVPTFLERALPAVKSAIPGVRPCPFGHVGDGNLHFNLTRPVDDSDEAFMRCRDKAHTVVHDIVAEMGGSIAAEHGIGRLKVDALQRYKQPVENDMLRAIKAALDPDNRLNPGVLAPSPACRPIMTYRRSPE